MMKNIIMRKIKLISILIFSVFLLVMGSSFVSAETKDFYFPINIETNLFEKFIQEIGLNNLLFPLKTMASQMTIQGNIMELKDGGGGAEDLNLSLDFPTENVYSFDSLSDANFLKELCVGDEDPKLCSSLRNKNLIHPWRVKKVEVITTAVNNDGNDPNCKTNAFITSPEIPCQMAFNDNLLIFGSSNSFCGKSPTEAYLDEGNFSNAPSGRACGHVRLDGGSLFDNTSWKGFLKATAVSPEYDNFGIRGKDADTGQVKTIKNSGSLEICSGETIEVFWKTKDVQEVFIVYGKEEPKKESLIGSRVVQLAEATNFSIVVKAATGDGIKYIYDGPVNVSLKDCQEEPPLIHCDKLDDLDNGTNPFCLAEYPEYGSRKKCCNWPENQGEFGDGCGRCEKETQIPEEELSVDLKVGLSDGPVSIDYGGTIQLIWTSINADNCSIFGPTGFIVSGGAKAGDIFVRDITSDRTYTLRCYQGNIIKNDSVDIFIDIPADESFVDLKANNSNGPITIDYGDSVNLTWTSQNVSNCIASDNWNPDNPDKNKPNQGQETISDITSNKVFTITCDDNQGTSVSDSVMVNLENLEIETDEPYIDLKVNGSDNRINVNYNSSVNLNWDSQGVSNCVAGGLWRGSKPENGQETSNVRNRGFFRIVCQDENGNNVSDRVPVVVTQSKGDARVFIRLDGEIVDAPDVSYNITGPESLSDSGQKIFSNVSAGTYTITYNEGLPPSPFDESIEFSDYSPARTLLLEGGQTITFYLNFETLSTCNLSVKAELASCGGSDFQPWSGVMTYSLLGPVNLNGTFAPQEFTDIPAASYLLNIINGPGILNRIIPSNPVTCSGGTSEEITARFEDCEAGVGGYRYSCNLQSQRCEICTGSVDECPFATLSECRNSCGEGGGSCDDDIDIVCWTNFDSNNCVGVIDGDSNPNIVLTNNLAGCSGVSSCQWQVLENPQYTQDSCAPFSWYDESGKYTAKITAIVNGTPTTDIQEFEIRDVEGVECSFVWNPQSISANNPIDFFDNSITRQGTNITSWYWTFTGANISTSTNQIVQNVVFSSPGNKEISIEVENDAGNTCSLTQTINVRRVIPDWIEVIPD
jgi:hypothetical protein